MRGEVFQHSAHIHIHTHTDVCPQFHRYHITSFLRKPYFRTLSSKWKVKVKSLSRVRLFATPWTVAYQAPPSMGFFRQECWSGLPFPSPGDLPDPEIKTWVSHIAGRCFTVWATREATWKQCKTKKETSTQVFKIQHYIQIHTIACITLPILPHTANNHSSRVCVSTQSLSHVQLSYFPSYHANTSQISSYWWPISFGPFLEM